MKTALIGLLLLAGCKSMSEAVIYRGVSREENARAIAAILTCLPQPECDELLGDQLECGPFLWRQLVVPELTNATFYTLPQTVRGSSQDVRWEGRRCVTREQCRALWRAFAEKIPQASLATVRTLDAEECRVYNALVPGEIREPVFIVEGNGHKILMQLAPVGKRLQVTFLDDFRNVSVKD